MRSANGRQRSKIRAHSCSAAAFTGTCGCTVAQRKSAKPAGIASPVCALRGASVALCATDWCGTESGALCLGVSADADALGDLIAERARERRAGERRIRQPEPRRVAVVVALREQGVRSRTARAIGTRTRAPRLASARRTAARAPTPPSRCIWRGAVWARLAGVPRRPSPRGKGLDALPAARRRARARRTCRTGGICLSCRTGYHAARDTEPHRFTRSSSSLRNGVWSTERSTATSLFPMRSAITARESPTFATYSLRPMIVATIAVVPA